MPGGAGNIIDVHRAALIHLGGAAGDDQRHAQGVGSGHGHGDALGFHGEDKVRRGVVVGGGQNIAHAADNLRAGQDVGQVQETAGQHTALSAELLTQMGNVFPGGLRLHRGAIAHTAGCAGHRVQLAQAKLRHHFPENVDILAHGGLGCAEQVAEVGKGEDAVGRIGENFHHGAHALVAADFIHGRSLLS